MKGISPRLTYANVIATIALFAALGGGAYATHSHKIGTKDLRNGAVKTKKVASQAVKAPKVASNAIKARTIAENAVRTRQIGNGAIRAGNLGEIIRVSTERFTVPAGEQRSSVANCPEDTVVLSGGGRFLTPFPRDPQVTLVLSDRDVDPNGNPDNGWLVEFRNNGTVDVDFVARAYCLEA